MLRPKTDQNSDLDGWNKRMFLSRKNRDKLTPPYPHWLNPPSPFRHTINFEISVVFVPKMRTSSSEESLPLVRKCPHWTNPHSPTADVVYEQPLTNYVCCKQSHSMDDLSTSLDSSSSSPSKTKKNRCTLCRKKLGLTGKCESFRLFFKQ